MPLHRSRRSQESPHEPYDPDTDRATRSTRLRPSAATSASATVSRSPSALPKEPVRSLRLTLRMSSGKLREATGSAGRSGRRNVNVFREDPIVSGPRSSRTRKRLVEVNTSDEDDLEDQEEDEVDDEDAPVEDDEDIDPDGDVDMDDAPPQAPIRRQARAAATARGKAAKSVEAKEMDLEEEEEEEDDDDEDEEDEVSDESDAEGEPDDQNESAVPDINADGLDEEDEEDDLDEDLDSDAVVAGRMTKRQRGNLGDDFLQLPMEPQIKKHLTAEERAMRRAEMARRRKNLSEKRNEEEKMDTINRLLRKQPPKKRGRAAEGADTTPGEQELQEPEKADPTMVRWISGCDGCSVNVPTEWLGAPAGRLFGSPVASTGTGKLVEEL